jgi:beta-N-acetylhexosaminidase
MTSLARQVGQLLWVGFDGLEPPPALLARIAAGELGGVILFRRNVESPAQVAALCARLHAAAPADAPLLLAVDQEGGRVQRLRAPATEWPPMLRLGERAARSPAAAAAAERLAESVGRALGLEVAAAGFDVDFAPVLDVHTNPENPVIGDRAFATTPALVARLGGAFARGLAAAGVIACGKHFPGHGDTSNDSHLELPRVDHDLARLRAVELAPFRALPELPLLMTAHVVFAAVDAEVPATLSRAVLHDMLRGELGYRGAIVSDDLEMKAIADHFGVEDAAVRAVAAGCDLLLVCHTEARQLGAHAALVCAAERDATLRARVADAAARVAALKAAHAARRAARPSLDVLGCAAHRALAAEMGAVAALHDPTERA